ncbi:MAG: hypothetical protein WA891_11575 [Acidobacteriaceae bacterium]
MLAELTALFQQLVDELPAGAASIKLSPETERRPAVISLLPTNPAAADFGVVFYGSDVHSVGFGIHQWEFPYERRYRKGEKDVLAEIQEMARAVVAGNCEQERRRFSITGRIDVGDYIYSVGDIPKFCKPPFGTRRYAPYSQLPIE